MVEEGYPILMPPLYCHPRACPGDPFIHTFKCSLCCTMGPRNECGDDSGGECGMTVEGRSARYHSFPIMLDQREGVVEVVQQGAPLLVAV